MAVRKDDPGRRYVQVEVEVPGTPEEVWKAVATDAGVSSWFVPTKTEHDANGIPVQITSNFGPGMDSVSKVTEWKPPQLLAAESQDLGPEAPTIATQWIVEAASGKTCIVRVVHSMFTDKDDWDTQLQGWEAGWPDFFRILGLYLAHFSGQPSAALQVSGGTAPPKSAAWSTLTDALGVGTPEVGETCESSGSAPALIGIVERVGTDAHPEELLLRLQSPAPGLAHFFAMEMGEQVYLSIRFFLYGPSAEKVKEREESTWQSWLTNKFPASSPSENP